MIDLSSISTKQMLVVEHEGIEKAAVVVEKHVDAPPLGNNPRPMSKVVRVLVTSIDTPCPHCERPWERSYELAGKIKILWPEHYRTPNDSDTLQNTEDASA